MSAADLLLVAMRWAHGLATIVWLGGGAYATLIQGRELRELDDREVAARIGRATGRPSGAGSTRRSIVFIVSGVILTFDRLASRGATVQYGIVLARENGAGALDVRHGAAVAAAAGPHGAAGHSRRRGRRWGRREPYSGLGRSSSCWRRY